MSESGGRRAGGGGPRSPIIWKAGAAYNLASAAAVPTSAGGGTDPLNKMEIYEDFINGSSATFTSNNWDWTQNSGGSAPIVIIDGSQDANHPGVVSLITSATGRCNILKGLNQFKFTSGTITFETMIKVVDLYDAAVDDFISYFGLSDQLVADASNGIYFEYDGATSANWRINTAKATTRTKTTTSTAVTTDWVVLKWVADIDTPLITYYINGVSVGTIATNIPTTHSEIVANTYKTVHTNQTTTLVDYIYYSHEFTNRGVY
jgi:hypothetical protein